MKPEFKAPPSPAHALIGLLFVLLIPNALYSKVNLPEVPASMIFDVADLIPPRHEAALSLQLRELESKENISIYLVYLEGEPKIRLDKISLYIVERWSSAPIYGLVISYPGYADGFLPSRRWFRCAEKGSPALEASFKKGGSCSRSGARGSDEVDWCDHRSWQRHSLHLKKRSKSKRRILTTAKLRFTMCRW